MTHATGEATRHTRLDAHEAVTRVSVCVDRLDRDGLRAAPAATVAVDHTSLSGGQPAAVTGNERLSTLAAHRGSQE